MLGQLCLYIQFAVIKNISFNIFVFSTLQAIRGKSGKAEEERKEQEMFSFCQNTWTLFSLLKCSELSNYSSSGSSGKTLNSLRESQNHFLILCTFHYISGRGIGEEYHVLLFGFGILIKILMTLFFKSMNSGRGWVQLLSPDAACCSFLGSWILKIWHETLPLWQTGKTATYFSFPLSAFLSSVTLHSSYQDDIYFLTPRI